MTLRGEDLPVVRADESAEPDAVLDACLITVREENRLWDRLRAAETRASNAEVIAESWKRPCERAEARCVELSATLERVRALADEYEATDEESAFFDFIPLLRAALGPAPAQAVEPTPDYVEVLQTLVDRALKAESRCAELERSHTVTRERALEACRQAMRHPGLFTARNLPGILVEIFAPAKLTTAPASDAHTDEPDPCSCDEALALRAQLMHMSTARDKAERRAKLWRQVAHIKHRLLHLAEPVRFDSQLTRPVEPRG